MVNNNKVVGAKAGDTPAKPNIAKDTVSSISTAKILYGLNDGEISGIIGGGKGIKLEDTPLLDETGKNNFEGVTWDFRAGTLDQEYIEGFPDISNEIPVSVELKSGVDWVKAVSNPVLSAVRIRLSWNGLKKQNLDNGDISGYKIDYAIDIKSGSGAYVEVLNTSINAKVTGKYEKTHRLNLPKSSNGWLIRVRRLTPNANLDNIADKMYIESITEVIDQKFTYPHTTLLGIQYDAKTFSRIAKLSVRAKGKLINVPVNYNSLTNTYSGIWNGQFKLEYSNNPAWIFYDLVTSKRYGLGKRIDKSMVDKWALYDLGVYCDALVDDGRGGQEKRYTCNIYIQSQTDAYQILSQLTGIFRAITYWNGQQLVLSADVPKDPTYTFSRDNVVDGDFEYSSARARDRHTIAKVAFDNPNENFKTEYEFIRDEEAIAQFGINVIDISAIGCTSRGQAQRAGLWALKSEQLETKTVSFRTGLEGFNVAVGDVIEVSDELLAGRANGGRVEAVADDLRSLTIDRDAVVGVNDFISVNANDGIAQRRKVVAVAGRVITLLTPFVAVEAGAVWAVSSTDLNTMQFRIMNIKPDEDNIHAITAIQHEPLKYAAIDSGADVKPTSISIIKPTNVAPPDNVELSANYRVIQGQAIATLVIQWSQVKDAVGYGVEWKKDNGNWIKLPITGNVSAEIEGIYEGNYQARVKSINSFDVESNFTNSIISNIKGKVGSPKALASISAVGVLFGMDIKWNFLAGSEDTNYTEIETATDATGSNKSVLGSFSYPTNQTTLNGLQGGLTVYFRGRIVDKLGNVSSWSNWVSGTTDASADKVLDILNGQITETQLNQSLTSKIDSIDSISIDMTEANNAIAQAKADIVTANEVIASNKLVANNAITAANTEITKAKEDIIAAKSVADLAKTDSAANKINLVAVNEAVANNKTAVDLSITTLVNKDLALSNLYTALRSEYDNNKATIDSSITTLTNKDIALTDITNTLTSKTDSALSRIAVTENTLIDVNQSIANTKTELTTAYKQAIDDIKIGGRNLLLYSSIGAFSGVVNKKPLSNDRYEIVGSKINIKNTVADLVGFDVINLEGITEVTISVYSNLPYVRTYFSFDVSQQQNTVFKAKGNNFHTLNIKAPEGAKKLTIGIGIYPYPSVFEPYYLDRLQAEEGNIATAWNKAPEDVEAEITAAIQVESTARSNAIESVANTVTTLDTDYKGNKTAIRNELTAVSTKTDSTANSLTSLTTEVGKNKTAITTEATTRSTEDTALSNRITTVSGKTDNALTRITTAETTLANNTGAITQQKTDITAAYKKAIDDIEVGGRNLLLNSKKPTYGNTDTGGITNNVTEDYAFLTSTHASANIYNYFLTQITEDLIAGNEYTFSIEINSNNVWGIYHRATGLGDFNLPNTDGKWVTIKKVFTPSTDHPKTTKYLSGFHTIKLGSEYKYRNLKIEKGNVATAWTQAPEEIEANITAAITRESTARTSAVEAVANTVTALDSRFEGNKATVSNSLTTLTNKDASLANSITALTTTVGNNTTAISTEATARSNADGALANAVNSMLVKTDATNAEISRVNSVVSSNTQSIAQTKTEITAAYKTAIDNIEIGGVNNIKHSNFYRGNLTNWGNNGGVIYAKVDGYNVAKLGTGAGIYQNFPIPEAKLYTFSFKAKALDNTTTAHIGFLNLDDRYRNDFYLTTEWKTFSYTTLYPVPVNTGMNFHIYSGGKPYYITDIMVEKGNKASSHALAPEDVEADYTAKISSEATTRANADGALSTRITNTEAVANNAQARVGTVESAVATNTGAIAQTSTKISAAIDAIEVGGRNLLLDSKFGTLTHSDTGGVIVTKNSDHVLLGSTHPSGNIYNYFITKVTDDMVLGQDYTFSIEVNTNNTMGWIARVGGFGYQQINIPNTNEKWVVIKQVFNNVSQVATNGFLLGFQGLIQGSVYKYRNMKIERGNKATAWTKTPEELEATTAAIEVKATATANKVTGLEAQYTVKLDVGGRVSGFGLASSTTYSDFAVNADRFYIAPPTGSSKGISPFMVLTTPTVINGVTVPTGTYMQSAFIHDGSIDIAKINKASINNLSAISANIGHFKSAETGARLEIKDSLLSVYDSSNRLRVRLGIW